MLPPAPDTVLVSERPTITLGSARGADAVVVGVLPGPDGPLLAGRTAVPAGACAAVLAAVRAAGMTGQEDEVQLVALAGERPGVIVAVGLGADPDSEMLRRAAGAGVRAVPAVRTVALALPMPDLHRLAAVSEGALLGGYSFDRYRVRARPGTRPGPRRLVVAGPDRSGAADVLHRAVVVADAVALARDLVNTPPSDLHPDALAELARDLGAVEGIAVEVLDEHHLQTGGFGGIVGVGQGSARPPRLVHLGYRGGGERLALVGKGVTFDSGGLSLKRPDELPEMKMDMAGAAAVLAAVRAIARLGLRLDVQAWLPLVENMPGGRALRPSDVLTLRNGLRVEVRDTDNEGRLILADALARATEDAPATVIDIATLTSAQMIALGRRTAAVMADDDTLRAEVVAAATHAGDPAWAMPLPAHLRAELDSPVADLANWAPREGAMLTAALFLREFVAPGWRWAHVDIAGPAFNAGEPHGYTPRGGTGAGVRTLVEYAERRHRVVAEWGGP